MPHRWRSRAISWSDEAVCCLSLSCQATEAAALPVTAGGWFSPALRGPYGLLSTVNAALVPEHSSRITSRLDSEERK
jgi:hypothetical protein